MFNSLNDALLVLYKRRNGSKPRLNHILRMLSDLGNHEKQLRVIHVTGTNGKGSTTNFLRNIYQEAGYRVASFTSPHLCCHNDRFRINNVNMSDEQLLFYLNWSYQYWDRYQLSMFEIDVLISIYYFIDQKVDLAIYEVGMGGRYDATNVFDNLACVITNVTFDHMQFLGNTLEDIAFEKAGIIKKCRFVFSNVSNKKILNIFQAETDYPLYLTPVYKWRHRFLEMFGLSFNLRSLASYQIENAALAINVVKTLSSRELLKVADKDLVNGINNTDWPGRFEFLDNDLPLIIDGAHNRDGILKLRESLKMLHQDFVVVFSALRDKDINNMLKQLLSDNYDIIITSFDNERRADYDDLNVDSRLRYYSDYHEAICEGYRIAKQLNKGLVITGSLYFISEVRKRWFIDGFNVC